MVVGRGKIVQKLQKHSKNSKRAVGRCRGAGSILSSGLGQFGLEFDEKPEPFG